MANHHIRVTVLVDGDEKPTWRNHKPTHVLRNG